MPALLTRMSMRPQPLAHGSDGRIDGRAIADVECDRERALPRGIENGGGVGEAGMAVEEQESRPVFEEEASDFESDAGSGPCDDRDLILQQHGGQIASTR